MSKLLKCKYSFFNQLVIEKTILTFLSTKKLQLNFNKLHQKLIRHSGNFRYIEFGKIFVFTHKNVFA